MFQKLTDYLKDTRLEMRKVNWPNRREAIRFTAMVVIVSAVIAGLLGAFDYIFRTILLLFV